MRALLSLFRRAQAVLPETPANSDGPEPTELALLAGGGNPIDALIDEWRLPRLQTRAEVAARVGISPDPTYDWDALVLREAVPLPGAMQPWTAQAFERIPPQFPITRFSGLVWHVDDAHENLHRVARFLAESLGPARVGKRWNTLVGNWRCGIAEVSIMAWPREWQSSELSNPAEERNPKLRTACHVTVTSSFRLALDAKEKVWVDGFRPLVFDGQVSAAQLAVPGADAPYETQLEYARDPDGLADDHRCSIGLAARDEALIVVSSQLFVIPREAIVKLEVTRLTPAKGGGGSSLRAVCRTAAPIDDGQSIGLASNSNPDGLNTFAQTLGKRLGCKVEISPYFPDC